MYLGDNAVVPNVIVTLPGWRWYLAAQHVVDESADVGDIDFVVCVNITSLAGVVIGKTSQQNIDEGVDVRYVDFPVAVDISRVDAEGIVVDRLNV